MGQPLIGLDGPGHGALLVSLAAGEGCASHAWLHSAALNAGTQATRNMADMLHLLSVLHGRSPGMIEVAAAQNVWPGADNWLHAIARGFATERNYLARLTVAAGPVPSTASEAATLSAVLAQRQALETLARSDRFGCAIGAVCGLVLDWQAWRAALDTAADRLGVEVPRLALPDEDVCAAIIDALPDRPRLDRTLTFGARQLLVQHSGLLDLLEARAGAREE